MASFSGCLAAGTKVAGIYELAEHILLDLDLPTLVVATQVCRSWRQIVVESRLVRGYLVEEALVDEPTKKLWSPVNLNMPWAMKAALANGWLFIYKLDSIEILLFAPDHDTTSMRVLDERVLLVHESGMKYGWKAWWRQKVPFVDSKLLWVTHPTLLDDCKPDFGIVRQQQSKLPFAITSPTEDRPSSLNIQLGDNSDDPRTQHARFSWLRRGSRPNLKLRKLSFSSEESRARWRDSRRILCVG
ncbi:hypothetical protein K431DRAFT_286288 [Polychaeton citri CBS 116435]|uniref:F-box domain-containing protein n=1 Tax=Polychaeton citri CBS 116435 TaxID=1314669 RepID=A0A9P4Q868_9PEZI|nr:hypothetical protein K431DRAFT_286288 [Polychaeton citri CBS 116435]